MAASTVPGSASPSVVPLPLSREDAVDPEEAFVAAISSCHMLTFLSIAAKKRFVVDAYEDEALGIMTQERERQALRLQGHARPGHRILGRQASRRRSRSPTCITSPTRNASSPIPCSRRLSWRAFPRIVSDHIQGFSAPMRLFASLLSDTDRSEMLARIGVNHVDELFADVPKSLLLKEPVDLPRRKGELEVERILARMAAKNIAGLVGAVLRRRRRLQAPCAGDRRSPDPALRVPDELHAVSAGDRAGHAAISVRVPDPGRGAHRHGGGERLHV